MRRAAWALAVLVALGACTPVGMPAPRTAPPAQIPSAEPESGARPEARSPVRPVRAFREVRGLWVVRWTMTSESQVREMVADAAASGFNTLIVQVRGRGDAFYRSDLEPRAESLEGPADFDPLELTIEEAHRRGMAVHAWVNTHLVWGPTAPPKSPDHLVNAHPEWLAVPRPLARDLYDMDPRDPRYYAALRKYAEDRPETVEGIYTSPSDPGVRARVRDVWMDLVDRYDLDGVHLDYIRYPSADFDYSHGSLQRFRDWALSRVSAARRAQIDEAARLNPLAWTTALPTEWDEYRRQQITSLVADIYHHVKAKRPELVVSAAVVPDPETAYGQRFQDWQGWLKSGILDIAVPMAYTPDSGRFQALIRSARSAAGSRERVWAGIGAYMNTLDGTVDEIDLARDEDAGGVVLFSYDWAAGDGRGTAADPFLQRLGRERFGSQ